MSGTLWALLARQAGAAVVLAVARPVDTNDVVTAHPSSDAKPALGMPRHRHVTPVRGVRRRCRSTEAGRFQAEPPFAQLPSEAVAMLFQPIAYRQHRAYSQLRRPPMTRQKELKRLLGPESERVKREHPDLAEQLRRYNDAWRSFRESVGQQQSTGAARRRQYRA